MAVSQPMVNGRFGENEPVQVFWTERQVWADSVEKAKDPEIGFCGEIQIY